MPEQHSRTAHWWSRPGWSHPIVVGLFAAVGAAAANGVANGIAIWSEKVRAGTTIRAEELREEEHVIDVIKTGDPDQAAVNLKFLIDAGVITNQTLLEHLNNYLEHLEHPPKPGQGPVLPSAK